MQLLKREQPATYNSTPDTAVPLTTRETKQPTRSAGFTDRVEDFLGYWIAPLVAILCAVPLGAQISGFTGKLAILIQSGSYPLNMGDLVRQTIGHPVAFFGWLGLYAMLTSLFFQAVAKRLSPNWQPAHDFQWLTRLLWGVLPVMLGLGCIGAFIPAIGAALVWAIPTVNVAVYIWFLATVERNLIKLTNYAPFRSFDLHDQR